MKKRWLSILAFMFTSIFLISCGDNEDESSVSSTNYGGPGSEWAMSKGDDGSFTVTHAPSPGAAADMTVTGTYETVTSGFMKMTVADASGTDAPTSGAQAYALEIPNFMFLLKPMDDDGAVIPMVIMGSCPTQDFTLNWIATNYGGSDAYSTSADIFGVASYSQASSQLNLTAQYSLQSYTDVTNPQSMSGSCSGGKMTIGSTPDAYMWLSNSGAVLVKTTHDNGVIVATPQATYTSSNLAGNYIGILFDGAGSSGDKNKLIHGTINSGVSSLVISDFSSIDAGTVGSTLHTMSIDNHSNKVTGIMEGTLSGKETACTVLENAGGTTKTMLFCTAISTTTSTEQLSFLLITQ